MLRRVSTRRGGVLPLNRKPPSRPATRRKKFRPVTWRPPGAARGSVTHDFERITGLLGTILREPRSAFLPKAAPRIKASNGVFAAASGTSRCLVRVAQPILGEKAVVGLILANRHRHAEHHDPLGPSRVAG